MYKIKQYTNNIIGDEMQQKINCDVYSCKHCDCDNRECLLEAIKVSNCTNDTNKRATMCDSYKKEK